MTGFEPPEDPPPEVVEHFRHLHEDRHRDWCRFCHRRAAKGGTGVLPEDYLPPVHIGAIQDILVGFRGLLDPPPNGEAVVSRIEGEAWDDGRPPTGPCSFDGFHCWHWSYTAEACCHCGSVTDSDDSRCPGRLR